MEGKTKVLLFLLFLIPASLRAEAPDVEEAFQNILDSYSQVSYVGRRIAISWHDGPRSVTHEEMVVKKAPDKLSIEILFPLEVRGRRMIRTTNKRWIEGAKDIKKDRLAPPAGHPAGPPPGLPPGPPSRRPPRRRGGPGAPPEGPPEFLHGEKFFRDLVLLKRNYSITITMGSDSDQGKLPRKPSTVAGRETYLIEITPKYQRSSG